MGALNAQETRNFHNYMQRYGMSLKAIFAVDEDHCIGYDNDLIYHNQEDLKFFREKTLNCAVIMGRKTFDSLGGKPLKDRLNIVVTHDPVAAKTRFKELKVPGSRRLVFTSNYNEIPQIMRQKNMRIGWVIGGKSILVDMQNVISTFCITQYRCKCTQIGQDYGLLPPSEPEDVDVGPFDPKKLVRVGDLMRRIRAMAHPMKLTPTEQFITPSGDSINYAVFSYIRPNPKVASKLAELRAEELADATMEAAIGAEREITKNITRRY